MVTPQRFTSRERCHSFPHRETAATLLPFLSSPCAWSGVCHISQMRGSHSQIPMWLPCPDPGPHSSSHRKPRASAPSIRHVRRSSPCHCSPLFPISYILHLTQQYIDAAARFHTTLTEILFFLIPVVVLRVKRYSCCLVINYPFSGCRSYLFSGWPRADSHIRLPDNRRHRPYVSSCLSRVSLLDLY